MGEKTRLNLLLQADGDVIISTEDTERGRRLGVEFCSVGSGGGRNPVIVNGLRDIIQKLVVEEKEERV